MFIASMETTGHKLLLTIPSLCMQYISILTVGHSPVDGSRVRTLTIDQSTVDGWTFKPLIIEHHASRHDVHPVASRSPSRHDVYIPTSLNTSS